MRPCGTLPALTLGPPTIGGAAGALSGNITGVGVLHEINNADGAFDHWNFADYRITAVPEPSALVLLSLAALSVVIGRRR